MPTIHIPVQSTTDRVFLGEAAGGWVVATVAKVGAARFEIVVFCAEPEGVGVVLTGG